MECPYLPFCQFAIQTQGLDLLKWLITAFDYRCRNPKRDKRGQLYLRKKAFFAEISRLVHEKAQGKLKIFYIARLFKDIVVKFNLKR